MQRSIQARFIVLLLVIGVGCAMAPQTAAAQTRPTPMGVPGGNSAIAWNTAHNACWNNDATLGALVADQNGTQYILGSAHVLAMGPSGYFGNGSGQPIIQPQLFPEPGSPGLTDSCNFSSSLISGAQVATLSTVIPQKFNGAINPTDAAIAQVLPGLVSPSIVGIPRFTGTLLTVVKKGLLVQKTGAASGNNTGKVISKMLMTEGIKGCQRIKTAKAETAASCGYAVRKVANCFEVKAATGYFSEAGDSGALVLTSGPCPQPVGILIAGTAGTAVTIVGAIGPTLQALMSAGGYSSLSVVPGGGGCTPTTAEVEVDGVTTLEDPTVADPDVAQALVVRADFMNDPLIALMLNLGTADGVGIDLSVSPAALDIIVDSAADLDPYHTVIPASYEGVTVEQDVINTIDTSGDTSDQGSGSN